MAFYVGLIKEADGNKTVACAADRPGNYLTVIMSIHVNARHHDRESMHDRLFSACSLQPMFPPIISMGFAFATRQASNQLWQRKPRRKSIPPSPPPPGYADEKSQH